MKQFFKMFFASLLAMIVAGVIVFGVIIGLIVSAVSKSTKDKNEVKVAANSVLVIDLAKTFHEQGQSNSFAILNNEDTYNSGLYEASNAIVEAKNDKDISGIFIKLSPTPNGWATAQQLRQAILAFKTSGKFVYAYGEDITQGAYYVASAADSIFLNPIGDVELKGLSTTIPFFKGTLDKLELQPEIFYAGKFKSATEPFRAEKMSEPNRQQTTEFMTDFWNQYVGAVAAHAHADPAMVNQWAQTGAIQFPEDALKYKLVDGLAYWDQVEQRMRQKTGTKDDKDIKYVSLNDYVNNVKNNRTLNDNKIAVLFAEGDIVDGNSREDYQIASHDIVKEIRKLRKNDKIKAVVLRVNSPGGSALASEIILRELQLLKQKKPLIVSMGNYAASGGYYISCQADSIFAMPNTITGSIGVFTMMFNTSNLLKNKLGVTFDGVKTAPYADFPSAIRPLTTDEGQRMQNQIDHIYGIFKSRVSLGRHMNMENVDSIAQGHVYSGTRALQLGLVDGLGNLERAIASAAKLANLKSYQVSTYPEAIDKWEAMLRRFKNKDAVDAMAKAMIENEAGTDFKYYKQVKTLRDIDGKAMMAMPFTYEVR